MAANKMTKNQARLYTRVSVDIAYEDDPLAYLRKHVSDFNSKNKLTYAMGIRIYREVFEIDISNTDIKRSLSDNTGEVITTSKKSDKAKRHLSDVASLGCVVCRNKGRRNRAVIHHMRTGMGMGMKNDDFHVIPLCNSNPGHHQHGGDGIAFHDTGRTAWEDRYGSELELHAQTTELLKRLPVSRYFETL